MPTVTATELARNFRRLLAMVESKREEIIVTRNHHEVARIVPGRTAMTALETMADIYGILDEVAAQDWLQDSRLPPQDLTDEVRDPK